MLVLLYGWTDAGSTLCEILYFSFKIGSLQSVPA